jgi:hypothetical protein
MSDRRAQIGAAKRVMVDYRLALQLPAGPLPPIWTELLHCIDERRIDLRAILTFAGPALSKNHG